MKKLKLNKVSLGVLSLKTTVVHSLFASTLKQYVFKPPLCVSPEYYRGNEKRRQIATCVYFKEKMLVCNSHSALVSKRLGSEVFEVVSLTPLFSYKH